MAQQAKMSSEAFEKFYFDACCMDYGRMTEGMSALEKRMNCLLYTSPSPRD